MSESRPESLWEQVNRLLGRYLAASSGLPPDLLAPGDLSRAWRSLPDGRDPLGAEDRSPEAEAQDPASASENGAGEVPVRSESIEAPSGQIPADGTSRDGTAPKDPLCRQKDDSSDPAPQEQAGDFQTEDEMYGDQLPAQSRAGNESSVPSTLEQAGGFRTEDEMYGDQLPARRSDPRTGDGSFLQEQAGDFRTEDELFGDRIPQKRRILAPQTEDEQYGDRLPPRRRAAPAPQTEDEVYGDRLPPRRPSGRTG